MIKFEPLFLKKVQMFSMVLISMDLPSNLLL